MNIKNSALYSAKQQKDQKNYNNQAEPATWIVAPVSRIRPARIAAESKYEKNHQKND
jgi:hypothetical protein